MELSIIIVNYNTKELLRQTMQSVIDTASNVAYEIIVIDNASNDESCELIKAKFADTVILIQNKENEGYAKANNKGIAIAKGKYILLLNSDTVVLKDCIKKCIDYMDKHKQMGVLGCKILLPDGKLDRACKRGFPTPEASLFYMLKLDKLYPKSQKFGRYNLTYIGEDQISEVDSLVGAFMMVRSEAIKEIGLLDEDFFMYGEDIDWCYRIKKAGWKVVYYPLAKIIHYKGASSKKRRFRTIYEFHRAMFLFYNKHYIKKYNPIITLLVYLGISIKLILTLILNVFKGRGMNDKRKSEIYK